MNKIKSDTGHYLQCLSSLNFEYSVMTFSRMLGELNEQQIETLLKNLPIGRIGCHADGITYIVPVNYVYDGNAIYAHSAKGLKIDMMRKNPEVCFQTDAIESLTDWQSVVAYRLLPTLIELYLYLLTVTLTVETKNPRKYLTYKGNLIF